MSLKAAIGVMFISFMIALYTTTLVPDGFSEPWKLRGFLTAARFATKFAQYSSMFGFDEARVLRRIESLYMSQKHQVNDTHVHLLDTSIEDVPVRLFWPVDRPKNAAMRGILFFHGGGWSIGSTVGYSPVTYELSKQLDAFVVSVEYSLAPEHIFPAGFNDCFKVTQYFLQNAKKYGVDPARIAIAGDSAGGNLAAAVTLRLRDEKVQPALKLQVLIYPSLQATDFNGPSMQYNQHGPFLTKTSTIHFKNLYMFGHFKYNGITSKNIHTSPEYKKTTAKSILNHSFLPNDELKKLHVPLGDDFGDVEFWNKHKTLLMNPYFSPLHAKSLKNLPHTYITTCQFDVLRDDGFFYAGALRKDGVKVSHDNQKVCFHAWLNFVDTLETSAELFSELTSYINSNL